MSSSMRRLSRRNCGNAAAERQQLSRLSGQKIRVRRHFQGESLTREITMICQFTVRRDKSAKD